MLLMQIPSRANEDRGSALIAVLALAGVTAVIAITIGTASVNSLQNTNSAVASVEARAAADAGVAFAEMALRSDGACDAEAGVFSSDSEPQFSVETFFDVGSGWEPGCPTPDATQVRFVSTGIAERPTFGAGAFGGERVVEAVYQYIPEYTELEAIDPAVYAYQITGTLNQFQLGIESNTVIQSDIQIRNGDFICQNNARVAGSVILANGKAELKSCDIDGDLYVSQTIELGRSGTNSSTIRDNLIAAGVNSAGNPMPNPVVFLDRGTTVGGDVFAGGGVSMDGPQESRVGGNLTAARDATTIVALANQSRVGGNVLTTGTINAAAGTIAGTRSGAVVGLQPPPPPIVPEWVDLPFTSSTVEDSTWWDRGFQNVVTWPAGSCSLGGTNAQWAAISTYTQRTIIDATACPGGIVVQSNLSPDVSLQTDVVFFANSFTFTKLPAQASNTTDPRRMYFVVPDNTPNKLPTCADGAGNITYNNESNINAPLALFFYTPCSVLSDRNYMRGQIYGGSVEFRQQAQWTFVPATPPGVDFSAGTETEQVLSGAFLGERLSIRELSSGG